MGREYLVVFLTLIVALWLPTTTFADHSTASVSIAQGTSVPGCEKTNECYIPYQVIIDQGGEVTWSNDDVAAHTATSGTAGEGPDGYFDSGLFLTGETFSVVFDGFNAGDYPYFCIVHPWMAGTVTVQGIQVEEEEMSQKTMQEESLAGFSPNGVIMVKILPSDIVENETMVIETEVTDSDGGELVHVNYDIKVTQNGEVVLDAKNGHFHDAKGSHSTSPLISYDPVDIEITLQGMGDGPIEERVGPIGDKIVFSSVVPEFGTMAMMILGITIIGVIALVTKSKIKTKI